MKARFPRVVALLAVFGALLALYAFGWRPWFRSWGATSAEVHAQLPGDELVTNAGTGTTRAITINASVDVVWPWLAQLGQDRGGFYSFEVLEDLVGTEMTNADRILPDRQQWKADDKLWMYPPDKLDGVGGAPLRVLQQGRVLVFATRHLSTPTTQPENGTWTFVLRPVDDQHTRLIVRGRGTKLSSTGWLAFDANVFDPVHYAMERKMMIGIAQRAEGSPVPSYAHDTAVVMTWFALFVLGIASAIATLRRAQWIRPLVCTFVAGLFFQIATLTQPGLFISLVLVAALAFGLWGRRPLTWSMHHMTGHPIRA
jgi:hypothetical protein